MEKDIKKESGMSASTLAHTLFTYTTFINLFARSFVYSCARGVHINLVVVNGKENEKENGKEGRTMMDGGSTCTSTHTRVQSTGTLPVNAWHYATQMVAGRLFSTGRAA